TSAYKATTSASNSRTSTSSRCDFADIRSRVDRRRGRVPEPGRSLDRGLARCENRNEGRATGFTGCDACGGRIMATVGREVPPLNPGDNMTREEFLRRWEMHPEIKRA